MYGMPIKRFDPDIYKGRKKMRNTDFIIGFLAAALIWLLFFRIAWYIGPLIVICFSIAGFFLKFRRRYFLYGALTLVFFPLVLWGALMILYKGRNEMKS